MMTSPIAFQVTYEVLPVGKHPATLRAIVAAHSEVDAATIVHAREGQPIVITHMHQMQRGDFVEVMA